MAQKNRTTRRGFETTISYPRPPRVHGFWTSKTHPPSHDTNEKKKKSTCRARTVPRMSRGCCHKASCASLGSIRLSVRLSARLSVRLSVHKPVLATCCAGHVSHRSGALIAQHADPTTSNRTSLYKLIRGEQCTSGQGSTQVHACACLLFLQRFAMHHLQSLTPQPISYTAAASSPRWSHAMSVAWCVRARASCVRDIHFFCSFRFLFLSLCIIRFCFGDVCVCVCVCCACSHVHVSGHPHAQFL